MRFLLFCLLTISLFSSEVFANKKNTRKKISGSNRSREEVNHLNQIRKNVFGKQTSDDVLRKNLNLRYSKKLYSFWIRYFTKRERKRFVRHMRNGKKYKRITDKIFKKHGIPMLPRKQG